MDPNSVFDPAVARGHTLSEFSKSLSRDVFIFLTPPASGLIGLNHRVNAMTWQKLRRWVRIIDPSNPQFIFKRVEVQKINVFHYHGNPYGDPITSECTDMIEPGNYQLYELPGSRRIGYFLFRSVMPKNSFAKLKLMAGMPGAIPGQVPKLHLYDIPDAVKIAVIERDRNQCALTGSSADETELAVSWIFPPACAGWLSHTGENYRLCKNREGMTVPSNAILLRKDLQEYFEDNSIGIDIDDEFRITIFRELPEAQTNMLKQFDSVPYFRRSGSEEFPDISLKFLKENFRHCLESWLMGGEIDKEYGADRINNELQILGLLPPDDHEDGPLDILPFSHEAWQTALGKEAFEIYMRNSTAP